MTKASLADLEGSTGLMHYLKSLLDFGRRLEGVKSLPAAVRNAPRSRHRRGLMLRTFACLFYIRSVGICRDASSKSLKLI
jgi:hypothetical protein